jgi:hypothetical protein
MAGPSSAKVKRQSADVVVLERDLASRDEGRRWAAAAELSEFTKKAPEALWPIILKHGASGDADLRQAVATCLLEHVLEYHFAHYFPLLEIEIKKGNANLRDTFSSCWKFGQSEQPENSKKWDRLLSAKK